MTYFCVCVCPRLCRPPSYRRDTADSWSPAGGIQLAFVWYWSAYHFLLAELGVTHIFPDNFFPQQLPASQTTDDVAAAMRLVMHCLTYPLCGSGMDTATTTTVPLAHCGGCFLFGQVRSNCMFENEKGAN